MKKILILSFRGSPRLKMIKSRLNKLKLKYKIIYGVNSKSKIGRKILNKNYNKKKTEFYIGRKLPFSEMSASFIHLKAYKYIVKNKIQKCIIMEDDAYPSNQIKKFFKEKFNKKKYIVGMMCYSGFVKKNPDFKLNKIFSIHKAKTHLLHISAYMCDIYFCKTILQYTKGKICGVSDWPLNLIKNEIYSSITLPYPVAINENHESLLSLDRKNFTPSYKIKKYIPKLIFELLNFFYIIFFIPYFTGRYKDLDFFKEHFYEKKLFFLKNLFFKNLIDTSKIYFNSKYYVKNLMFVVNSNQKINKKL